MDSTANNAGKRKRENSSDSELDEELKHKRPVGGMMRIRTSTPQRTTRAMCKKSTKFIHQVLFLTKVIVFDNINL